MHHRQKQDTATDNAMFAFNGCIPWNNYGGKLHLCHLRKMNPVTVSPSACKGQYLWIFYFKSFEQTG